MLKIYFAPGSAEVTPAADPALMEIVSAVKGGARAKVSGYHDASGGAAMNAELAKRRAMRVADMLKRAGAPEDSVILEKPQSTLADGRPSEGRRVEVTLQN